MRTQRCRGLVQLVSCSQVTSPFSYSNSSIVSQLATLLLLVVVASPAPAPRARLGEEEGWKLESNAAAFRRWISVQALTKMGLTKVNA
jgi:hypothetical protein